MSFRNAILVVGPPRSGTSAVCHVLNECGIGFGDPAKFVDPAVNTHNPLFFELIELNELNERMMARMGWSYIDFHATPLHEDFSSALADEFEQDVTSLVAQFGDALWFGLKDPRFCFTLPLWVGLLSRQGIRPRILRTRRDPEAVASSNFRLSPERGIQYGRRIARLSDSAAAYFLRDIAHETVRFEDLRAGQLEAVQALSATASVEPAKVQAACRRTFRDNLVHWRSSAAYDGEDGAASADDYESLGLMMRKFDLSPCIFEESRQSGGKASLTQLDLTPSDQLPFAHGPVQVYYRRDCEVFAEERSVVVPWPSRDWEEMISVELPHPGGEYFRVDVNTSPGAYVVQALTIDGEDVVPLSAFAGANGAAYELPDGAVGLVANHVDPWINFRSPHGAASALTVRIQRMTPEEAGRRLFDDRRIERAIEDLQQRTSQSGDRAVDHVARLHQTFTEESERLDVHLAGIEARLSRRLLGEVARLNELQAGLMERLAHDGTLLLALAEQLEGVRSAQALSAQDHAREAAHLQDALGSLEQMRRISLMGWWEKRKFKRGNENKL